MTHVKNPLQLYSLLPKTKTNCGQCQEPSCMAFAVAVIQGRKAPTACPFLDATQAAEISAGITPRQSRSDDQQEVIDQLRQRLTTIDFSTAATRLNANLVEGRLAITCLGKDFLIDRQGQMSSQCHVNHWVLLPLLHYIISCQGREAGTDWVPFAELEGAVDWQRFFSHRCEEALRQLVDAHPEVVIELLTLLGAKAPADSLAADHALLLFPLPRVPLLVCYWRPEEHFESRLQLLFDRSAAVNATPEGLYLLTRGIIEMIRQLIVRHSRDGKLF